MTITPELLLGITGTLTGSAGLFISWKTWYEDRPNLKMEASITATDSYRNPKIHWQLKATLTNRGRRVIKIRRLGIILIENKWELLVEILEWLRIRRLNGVRVEDSRLEPFNFRRGKLELQEGDCHDFEVDPFDLALVARARKSGKRVVIVYAIDSLNKEYRAKAEIPDEKTRKELEGLNSPDAANTK